MTPKAVITGDIIKSSRISDKERLLEGIKTAFKEINRKILNNDIQG